MPKRIDLKGATDVTGANTPVVCQNSAVDEGTRYCLDRNGRRYGEICKRPQECDRRYAPESSD